MKSLMLKLVAAIMWAGTLLVLPTYAVDLKGVCDKTRLAGCPGTKTEAGLGAQGGYLSSLLDTFLYIAAAVSLIFLIVGGIRYMTSTGDAGRIQQAKDIVLYSVIGLVVAILARLIVGFVIGGVG